MDRHRSLRRLRLFCALSFALLASQARGVVGLTRTELTRVYGPVQEESKSVYGDQFEDLIFLERSTADGNRIIVAATMIGAQCQAVSYVKIDAQEKAAPLTQEEVRSQMVASSRKLGGAWKQVKPKEWELDSGVDGSRKLKAQWTKPELFQVFTEEMLEKTRVP